MKLSVLIPTIGKAKVTRILPYWKDADEIIVVDNPQKQVVDNYIDGLKKAEGDIIVFINDRCVIKKGWRKMLEEAFTDFSGVVSFAPIFVTNGAISRDYIEKYQKGCIYWYEYIHHYADLELAQKAQALGMYKEVDGWIRCFPKKSKVIDRKKELRQVQWDVTTYWKRKKKDFPNEILSDMKKRERCMYVY